MGADIKNLRTRIKSVDSTMHLTKAMGLVASSKIRKASIAMTVGRDYAGAAEEAVAALVASPECRKSSYMRENGGDTVLIVIAGDRGLCGGYNANIFRLMREYADARVIPIGKRACERFGGSFVSSEKYTREEGYALAKSLCGDFSDGKFGKLGIVCTKYLSAMSQEAVVKWVIPLDVKVKPSKSSMIFEPDEKSILDAAVTEYVAGMIMAAVRESFACEVAARRNAMDSAGKNAQQMMTDLNLSYNRARQGAITQEITEIVAGSGG